TLCKITMLIAAIVFFLALLAIIALFVQKQRELRRGRVLFPSLKKHADRHADQIKDLMFAASTDLEKLPPEIARLSRTALHQGALSLAALARELERGAHQLAELVSHKRGFEKRETRSEFLKKMTEH